ncbi:MAG: hypothetical protein ACREP9_13345, partial [Candidatus Dormibacteraceae bacterium]
MSWVEELTRSGASFSIWVWVIIALLVAALVVVRTVTFFKLRRGDQMVSANPSAQEETPAAKSDSTALLTPPTGQSENHSILPAEDHALTNGLPLEPSRLRLLGLVLGLLSDHTAQEQPPHLGTAIAKLGDGDQEMARSRLSTLALALMGEDQASGDGEAQLREFLAAVLEEDLAEGIPFGAMPEFQQAMAGISLDLRQKLDTVVWSR